MKKLLIISINLVLLTFLIILFRMIFVNESTDYISPYIAFVLIVNLVLALTMYGVYGLIIVLFFRAKFRNDSLHVITTRLSLSVILGFSIIAIFYFFAVFANPYTLSFKVTPNIVRGLIPIFIVGLLLPFTELWIERLLGGVKFKKLAN
jgi:hypothetical protein